MSLCGLLLCLAADITPIITSSSDAKIDSIKKLAASPDMVCGINYKTATSIAAEVLEITGGKGVDYVVNNTGPGSIPQDIEMLRAKNGVVSLVGFLQGFGGDWDASSLMALIGKNAAVK